MPDDPVALCAENAAGCLEAWLTALGLRWERTGSMIRALDQPPSIYWSAIALAPGSRAWDFAEVRGTLCDPWSDLDLAPLGFEERSLDGDAETAREPWFVRPPGSLPRRRHRRPLELEVVAASTPEEVAEFEAVAVRGFDGEDATVERFSFHPPSILADDRMTMLIGRVEGRPVAAAMGFRAEGSVGIYGVTTVASARRRGYATELTRALIDPRMPAILSPSPQGAGMYRRLGFEPMGELRQWRRAAPRTPTLDDVRRLALSLPRSYEALVRDRVKFRVGSIVYLSFSRDESLMGFGFPKEEREALVASEPDKFLMPRPSDMRYHWVVVRLEAIDLEEMRELVVDSWRMCVPKRVAAAHLGG
jgi:hypothetical protein